MRNFLVSLLLLLPAFSAWAYPVAGLAPDRRPEGVPIQDAPEGGARMESLLLRGISKPIPESIQRWIKDQGGWFTPFSRPGMPSPYDVRGLHEH